MRPSVPRAAFSLSASVGNRPPAHSQYAFASSHLMNATGSSACRPQSGSGGSGRPVLAANRLYRSTVNGSLSIRNVDTSTVCGSGAPSVSRFPIRNSPSGTRTMIAPSRTRRYSSNPSAFFPSGVRVGCDGEPLPAPPGVTATVLPRTTDTPRLTTGPDAPATRPSRCPTGPLASTRPPSAPVRPATPPSSSTSDPGAASMTATAPYSVPPSRPAHPARMRTNTSCTPSFSRPPASTATGTTYSSPGSSRVPRRSLTGAPYCGFPSCVCPVSCLVVNVTKTCAAPTGPGSIAPESHPTTAVTSSISTGAAPEDAPALPPNAPAPQRTASPSVLHAAYVRGVPALLACTTSHDSTGPTFRFATVSTRTSNRRVTAPSSGAAATPGNDAATSHAATSSGSDLPPRFACTLDHPRKKRQTGRSFGRPACRPDGSVLYPASSSAR